MKIIVCVKQVPDTTEVKIDPVTNTLVRQGVPSIVNPFDLNALEAALRLKEKHGGEIVVISMGPPQATDALKECLAMGADKSFLVSDRAFGGADTLATSYTLAAAIRAQAADFDLIICGKQAIDGDTAQVGPEMAEHLDISQITYVAKIEIDGKKVIVEREHEEGYEQIETTLPCLLTVVKSIADPRLPTIKGTIKANATEIPVVTAADLKVDENQLGLKGSPTQVKKIFTPERRTQGEMINGETAQQCVEILMQRLSDAKLL
jgi:electron transfer flavoprotein beta subunit